MFYFYETAKQWVEELRAQNKCDSSNAEQLAREYAQKLEAFFNEEIKKQLAPVNKADEFERMLLWDTQYMNKYLNQTIPAFYAFREEVFKKAKKFILSQE
jgi:hypothetical protein